MLSSLPGCSAETPAPDGSKQLGGRRIVWDRTPLAEATSESAHKQLVHVPASAPAQQTEGVEPAGTDKFLALETAAEADGNAGELAVQQPAPAREGCSGETEGDAGAPAILSTLSLSCKHVALLTAAAGAVSKAGNDNTRPALACVAVCAWKQLRRQLPGSGNCCRRCSCHNLCLYLAALAVKKCPATPVIIALRRQEATSCNAARSRRSHHIFASGSHAA